MKLPVQWLKDYVNIEEIAHDTLVERLIMTGSNSEGSYALADKVKKIVVGHIKSITQHPDADKLKICQTDIGDDVIQIVTAATNMREGDYVPVALHGAILADGSKIKKGKLRGEVSNGMFCSLEELGVEKNLVPKKYEDGLLIFEKALPLGEDVAALLKLSEPVIEFEITPNRPDCLSVVGLARETAATFDRKMTLPALDEAATKGETDAVRVQIEDGAACPRYMAKRVDGIVVAPSPMWLQVRLMQAGMRPVNNIVDITNYVMLEFGQPVHAFDYDKLKSTQIGVRFAKSGEVFTTLDGKERTLENDMLVVTSDDAPVAIAGVMGGADTEVSETTTSILLEVANFNKSTVRKTSKDLGLRTEASSRFEKGVDVATVEIAMQRLCTLLTEIAGAKPVEGVCDCYPLTRDVQKITFDPAFINRTIGMDLSRDEIVKCLARLEIAVEGDVAIVPSYRLDLEKPIDLVEEVARVYGYDNIDMTLPKMNVWGAYTNGQRIEIKAVNALTASGADEILTYSFVSEKELDKINVSGESLLRQQVRLINPLGEEFSTMRTTLVPSLLEVLSRNYNRKIKGARLFEIGNIFIPKEMPVQSEPIEKKVLVIGTYGEAESFYTLKGLVENLLLALGIEGYHFEKETKHATYHTGRCANLIWNGHVLGTLGEVHPLVMENYNLGTRTYVADIDFNILMQITNESPRFKSIPKYPAIERDMAVVVKEAITSHEIEKIVAGECGDIFEAIEWFDLYRGPQIPEGCKSLAYALKFRAADRTLTDDEVNPLFDKALKALEEKLGATLR
ncbi:phenylalanine--tRNA ligase subunit beta [Fusibacter sp. JL298sf-3]